MVDPGWHVSLKYIYLYFFKKNNYYKKFTQSPIPMHSSLLLIVEWINKYMELWTYRQLVYCDAFIFLSFSFSLFLKYPSIFLCIHHSFYLSLFILSLSLHPFTLTLFLSFSNTFPCFPYARRHSLTSHHWLVTSTSLPCRIEITYG